MKKILIITISLLAIAIIATAFGLKGNKEESSQKNIREVQTVKTKTIDYQPAIFASGQLASKEEIKLSFKTGGIIRKIYVSEGQFVKKGQLLAILDLNEINAQAQQAQIGKQQADINIENAKLALKIAERDYRNTNGLYQDSVATLEQLENAQLQLDNARNQLESAQAGSSFNQKNIQIANFNVSHSKITAPSNGIILKKVAEANEMVGPGTPILFFGSKDKAQVIRVSITDKDIININLEDKAQVRFDAYPRHKFQGIVKEIASMADPYTGTFEVEVEIQSEGKKLLSGFVGAVTILTQANNKIIEIPTDALVSADRDRGWVYTVNNEQAQKKEIVILKLEGDNILVQSGLESDQDLVVSGAGYLQDGEQISIKND